MNPRVLVLLAALFAAGCERPAWQTTDIGALMPPLDFELVRADGGVMSADQLRGSVVLLSFGYASCPDVCPATLGRLTALKRRLPPGQAESVQILFVSVDPGRDTPERLAAFTDHFGGGVVGVTGERAPLEALARRYRTTFSYGEPDTGGFYEVTHSSGVYVFDRQGRARLLFRPGDTLDAMASDLFRLLD